MSFRLSGAHREALDDLGGIERLLAEAVRLAGLAAVASVHHRFEPQGVSAALILAESHIAIHTWPEDGTAYTTLTSCREVTEPVVERIESLMVRALGADAAVHAAVVL